SAEGQVGDAARVRVLTELAGVSSSAVNTVCVLLADDPLTRRDDAVQAKRALGILVAGVIPCNAQLATAANAGVVTERLVAALRPAAVSLCDEGRPWARGARANLIPRVRGGLPARPCRGAAVRAAHARARFGLEPPALRG